MPKSSQAARNSCLSAARSSGSRRRQAGSTLKNVNLANVRSGIGVTIALVVLAVGAGSVGGGSLNFFVEPTPAGASEPASKKVQGASPHLRTPPSSSAGGPTVSFEFRASGPRVTLVWLPPGAG